MNSKVVELLEWAFVLPVTLNQAFDSSFVRPRFVAFADSFASVFVASYRDGRFHSFDFAV